MRRVISLILIFVLLASQFCSPAHSHAGTPAKDLADHATRPHFHMQGTHNHHHGDGHSHSHSHPHQDGDETPKSDDVLPGLNADDRIDHDIDAVYFPDVVTSAATRQWRKDMPTGTLIALAILSISGIWDSAGTIVANRQDLPPPFLSQNRPLFLRNLSIRC